MKVECTCAGVNKRMYARTNTRDAHVQSSGKSAAASRFRAGKKQHAEVTNELAPYKGNVEGMCRSVDRWSIYFGTSLLPSSSSSYTLIRRTVDGGHLFRRMLTLRQRAALHRVEFQPSVVTVRHHRAETEKRCNAEGLGVTRVVSCERGG